MEGSTTARLVVAGGYDPRVAENVAYLKELEALAAEKGVAQHVTFSPSVSDAERDRLLQGASCVVYTPENEHFGIVPVEAMYAGAPVLAAARAFVAARPDGLAGAHCHGGGGLAPGACIARQLGEHAEALVRDRRRGRFSCGAADEPAAALLEPASESDGVPTALIRHLLCLESL